MRNSFLFFLLVNFFGNGLQAQQGTDQPLGMRFDHLIDRMEISTGNSPSFHTSMRPYNRSAMTKYALQLDSITTGKTEKEAQDIRALLVENHDWVRRIDPDYYQSQLQPTFQKGKQRAGFFRHFYKTPANYLEAESDHFYFALNPLLNTKLGFIKDEDGPYYFNDRGASIRIGIDDKVFLYTNVLIGDYRFPDYVNDRNIATNSVPGSAGYRGYESSILGIEDGYETLNSQGYLAVNISKHVGLQFGHGQHFIGNGYRSLLLSNYAPQYLFLKFNWQIWRLQYQNLFTELVSQTNGIKPVPRKYMTTHYLSFNVSPKFNIGLFESTIFEREDHFDFQYLNPVILYRPIERALGSPDNVLMGLNAKWNFRKNMQLYGQVIIDEFKINELKNYKNGWWGNKFGWQLGGKYINLLGVDHLDGQIEYNLVRPYTYTHKISQPDSYSSSYTHYHQPLAHPLGANFKELIFIFKYQFNNKIFAQARYLNINTGEDEANINWGSNILALNESRAQEYGNRIGQGVAANIQIMGLDVSYQIYHNVFFELQYFLRNKESDDNSRDTNTSFIAAGIRVNLPNNNRFDF